MKKTAILFLLVILAVSLAGCTGKQAVSEEIVRDTVRVHYEHHEDWSFGFGCYEKVSGYAYNAGNISAGTVLLEFNLVNTQTGTIRDSRSVFLGTMGAGQSGRFETDLDGECLSDYRVDGAIPA